MWYRDKLVWIGAIIGAFATAYALFVGSYLPYIDWSNHLALISVLAHGETSGALDFMTRSWIPTPYFLFYGLSALLSQFMNVNAASKLVLVSSALLYSLGAAAWAESMDRSPRQGLIAALGFFGVSLGYGFASFVFATPFLFFALAAAEPFFNQVAQRRDFIKLALFLCLAYLGHALIFMAIAGLLIVRTFIHLIFTRRIKTLVSIAIAALPSVLLAIPATVEHLSQPWQEPGTASTVKPQLAYFVSWGEHKRNIFGHLLERGSAEHLVVMKFAAALWCAWFLWGLLHRNKRGENPIKSSPWIYATCLLALFLIGPNSIEWPSSLWMIYPRFGVIAATSVFLLPRPELKGPWGLGLALAATLLVVSNARINAKHVARFSEWAKLYQPVRELIPKKSRVLALSVPDGRDLVRRHPALGSLYFYHMVDGASYVAFMFDAAALPVRQLAEKKPRAPFWKTPYAFNPSTHGLDFDYLVIRGKGLTKRTDKVGLHQKIGSPNGWTVYRTINPSPRP